MESKNSLIEQKGYIEEIKEFNLKFEQFYKKKKSFYIVTFGCQMNENDSEKLTGMLVEMGYCEANNKEESDFIIFNTCCVREHAEEKVYGHLGVLKSMKKKNKELLIAVCGCMMQQDNVVSFIKKTYTHVDIVFGTHNIHRLPELIYKVYESKKRVIEIWKGERKITEGLPFNRKDKIKAWVTVMYGCNNYCSYCIVPYVRGRERSREIKDILAEVYGLAKNGYKEITLLGQNVNSYGNDLKDNIDFSKLLNKLNKVDGIKRIRFMTSHPKDLSDNLIESIYNNEKVCSYLHLPFQAGSSKVLKEMNRVYTKEEYIRLIDKIKSKIHNIALTTDIIVGFPGETEEDFNDTLDIVKEVEFDSAYTFLYSKRTGTPASKREDQISEELKKDRFDRLIKMQNSISKKKNETYVGKTVSVLVEGKSKNSANMYTGRTESNKVVNFEGYDEYIGKVVNIKIKKAQTWSLTGIILN